MSAAGGVPQVLTTPDRAHREKTHRFPEILPGGKAVLFTSPTADVASYDDAQIEVLSLETGARRVLIEGGMYARYSPTGHIVYARAGALFAVPFDLDRLEVTGTPVQVLEGVATVPNDGLAHFALSRVGSLVYLPGGLSTFDNSLLWIDRQGNRQPINAKGQRNFGDLRLSPEGQRIAVHIRKASDEIWIYDTVRDAFSRLAFGWNNQVPVWTPDGARITFSSDRAGVFNVFWQPADGSGPAERLTTSAHDQFPYSWSPDGKALAFTEDDPTTHSDIWMLPMDGDRKPKPFLHEAYSELRPAFSPDGRWLAYVSDETGRNEIYVRSYPGPGGKWQISTDGGWSPVWAHNGRELFYEEPGLKLMGAEIAAGAGFSATKPRLVVQMSGLGAFDVSPDGRQFVVESYQPPPQATQINLVLNWFEELKRRAPTGR